ncbi:FtsK/SpoIIIE domain-containing protein [Micromonospora sp. NBC_01813]|uniref:FtsK/SpoIIIE domain-containing protein n=1 Tax=Micromonospora sp. NBC_01813 TaxID=2975988 RepID=UPI002DD81091|nr:FtsK/SpoIIIE domain-containing protein [Micromonospora sp. NBC_01813]WSA10168.1 FtsK/SpoIIIE domain-containing protein [Micromonospora sp. NBC_01813]
MSVRDQRQTGAVPGARGTGRVRTVDVTLGASAVDATVGELLDVVVGGVAAQTATGAVAVDLDGTPVAAGTRLADAPLWAGSVLTVSPTRETHPVEVGGDDPGALRMSRVAGPDSGQAVPLSVGRYALGRAAAAGLALGPVARPAVHLEVAPDGRVAVSAAGAADAVRVDGRELAEGECRDGTFLRLADAAIRIAPAAREMSSPLPGPPDGSGGREPLIRTPRIATTAPPAQVALPDAPAPASVPAPLSWLLLIAPLPIGIVMAFVFSPFFLVMVAMTPMMAVARWIESKHRAKKDARRIAAQTAAAAEQFAADLDATRATVAAAARATYPDLDMLARRAVTGRRLWEVRPGDPDELRIGIGVGDRPWQPDLGRRGLEELTRRAELHAALAGRARLVDVPTFVELRERSGFGAVGPVAVAARAVAAVALDLVTRHGPADLTLALLVEPHRASAWDWLKWLPHLATDDGGLRVATDPAAAEQLLAPYVASVDSKTADGVPHLVLIVDGEALLTGRIASLLGRLARGRGRALVVASRADLLPSVCRTFLELRGDGTAELTDAVTGERTAGLLAVQAAPDVCERAARALARWTDPEQTVATALLPAKVRLVDLLRTVVAGPQGLGRPVDDLDGATIDAWWRRGADGLQATIGVAESGPLTLDLLDDGPHGLVVGTTGAGKSELLRTLVASLACAYSPDVLTFLLVDFKGGGAFDACAGLPHTVGLVTDLDEHLAARALRCLRAELRHRERRLRQAGVSDLSDLLAADPPLPRLLIVIDEFATLAVELPGFISALVDVAQRGRSLGIHLLLATQRPQGVVDSKIRANTNLRVALRMQDDADSRDVIGTRQAADIDRRRPGRAYVRLGAGEVVGAQTALVSTAVAQARPARIEVVPFGLVGAQEAEPAGGQPPSGPTDLERLSESARQAAVLGGYRAPRVPCPPPLPTDVDAWTLVAHRPVDGDCQVPLGLVDLPDEQRADVWSWSPAAGGTVVLGADVTATCAVLATACLGLARLRPPRRQRILVLEGVSGGLGALAGLPHVGAVVGVDDSERLARVLDQVDAEIVGRRASGAAGADILLVVVGWDALVEGAERAGLADVGTRLERVLRDGAPLGVRLLVSAAHERGLPGRVLAQLGTKLCLRMADANSYTGLGLRARDLPELRGLRAIDLATRHEVQIGRYGAGTADGLAEAVGRVAAEHPDAGPAATVAVLPALVPAAEVLPASTVAGQVWRLGIGRTYRDLSVATLALGPGMHATVAGPAGSGRTTALRTIAAAARSSMPEATIAVVTTDPAAWAGGVATTVVRSVAELAGWRPAGRGLLMVDGIESVGDAGPALDRLLPTLPAQAHAIVAGRPDMFRGMQPWQRAVTMSRTGLLLRPAPDDGEVLRIRLPREAPLRPLPGRGYLVEAGGLEQVQVAVLPEQPAVSDEIDPPEPPVPALTLPVGLFTGGAR